MTASVSSYQNVQAGPPPLVGSDRKAQSSSLHIKCGFSSVFTIFLLLIYELEIATRWAYYGFSPISNYTYYLLILCISLILSASIPLRHNTRSFLLTSSLYIFFIPSIILGVANRSVEHLSAVGVAVTLILLCSSIKIRPIRLPPVGASRFLKLALIISGLLALSLVLSGAGRTFNLDIFSIYGLRAEATANMSAAMAYTFSGVSKVILPIAVIFAMRLREWWALALAGVFVILIYGMMHHKSVLVLPLAVGALYYLQKIRRDNLLIHAFFCAVVVISFVDVLAIMHFKNAGLFTSFITRRIFFLPPLIDSFYIDFFSSGEKLYWSTSGIGFGFAENPYPVTAPYLIGELYFGSSEMGANTGIVGSGFAHAGLLGVAVYSALLGLIIGVLNCYGRVIGHAIISCVSVPIIITIINTSDLSTVLLTHGLAFLLIILLIFPSAKYREN